MELLRKPVTIVWAALMLATCASTWLLSKNSVTPEVATVAILLIAAFKVRLVMRYFMEVRRAPLALRLICDGWLLAVTALIVTVYLVVIRRTAVGCAARAGRPDTRHCRIGLYLRDGLRVHCNRFALPMRERIAIDVL